MARASAPVANFVVQRFPTSLSKQRLQHSVVMCSCPSSSSNLLLSTAQSSSIETDQLRRGGKLSSSAPAQAFVASPKDATHYGRCSLSTECPTLVARSLIAAGKPLRGYADALSSRSWLQGQRFSARLENNSASTAASAMNLNREGNSAGGAAQASSLSTNATGGAIFADPSRPRKANKKKEFAPDAKLAKIRSLFDENSIDAYIVPSEDAHQSEFMADAYLRRAYVSGFTGSAGSVVITKDKAALWTDGRYFLQAESQLGSEWTLMRAGTTGVPGMSEWIRDNMPEGSKVGIDPYLFSSDASEELKRTIGIRGHSLVSLYSTNLVDQVWGNDIPSPPQNLLRLHDIKFAGIDVPTKLANLRKDLIASGATAIVITMLDEVAWLLNLRGNDVPHSPVAYAYAIVQLDSATLFVDESKVTPEVAEHLAKASVDVKPYAELVSDVKSLALEGAKLWLDPSKVSVAIIDAFNDSYARYYSDLNGGKAQETEWDSPMAESSDTKPLQEATGPAAIYRLSPVSLAKAVKNSAELEGMKQAHLRDAAALSEFFAWIEKEIIDKKQTFTEVEVAERLDQFRAKQPGFLDTSFDTISGCGPNGAIVHYRAEAGTCGPVNTEKLLLLDSGAQYIDGTTDITRTVHFGVPTSRERECFTRVLQGHIAVDRAIFPEGTPGFVLDVLARTSLWKIGLDYRHGTGHGVGAGLNVHEGPQGISSRFGNMTGLQAGMVVSNEPGYYEDRAFGVRIENLVFIKEAETENRFGGVTFLRFDRLTFVPIQTKMLELSLLSDEEIKWLNDYHTEVKEKVSPLVSGDALEWLKRSTTPILGAKSAGPKASEEFAALSMTRKRSRDTDQGSHTESPSSG